jgi:hypothetical protein
MSDMKTIQLGFLETGVNVLFDETDWRNWDGGKVGGIVAFVN